jgi:hypothetical protein
VVALAAILASGIDPNGGAAGGEVFEKINCPSSAASPHGRADLLKNAFQKTHHAIVSRL